MEPVTSVARRKLLTTNFLSPGECTTFLAGAGSKPTLQSIGNPSFSLVRMQPSNRRQIPSFVASATLPSLIYQNLGSYRSNDAGALVLYLTLLTGALTLLGTRSRSNERT